MVFQEIAASRVNGPALALAVPLLVSPVLEEVVFRLGLQESLLARQQAGDSWFAWRAVVLTALAFAAAHLLLRPGLVSALTFFPALLLGMAYQRWRALLPCVALHALFNTAWWLQAGHLA